VSTVHARRTDTAVALSLSLTQGGPVTGASPTLSIREGGSSTSYLDFADATFKAAGWATKAAALAEVGGGFYHLAGGLDVSAITNLPAGDTLLAEFTNPSGQARGVAVDTIALEPLADGIERTLVLERINAWIRGRSTLDTGGALPEVAYFAEDDLTELFSFTKDTNERAPS